MTPPTIIHRAGVVLTCPGVHQHAKLFGVEPSTARELAFEIRDPDFPGVYYDGRQLLELGEKLLYELPLLSPE